MNVPENLAVFLFTVEDTGKVTPDQVYLSDYTGLKPTRTYVLFKNLQI